MASIVRSKKPALLFPGQGNQQKAMLQPYLDQFPSIVSPILDRIDNALGINFSKLLVNKPPTSSASSIAKSNENVEDINNTSNAQPAIVATSYTIFEILKTQLVSSSSKQSQTEFLNKTFSYTMGHSLGEFTAATVAGVLQFDDTIKLVRQRGLAMESARDAFLQTHNVELGMFVVMLLSRDFTSTDIIQYFDTFIRDPTTQTLISPREELQQQLSKECDPEAYDLLQYLELGNINAKAQVVLSGPKKAADLFIDLLKSHYATTKSSSRQLKLKTIPLNVRAPFHCPIMKPAQDHMQTLVKELLDKNQISWPYNSSNPATNSIPIVSNITAKPFENLDQLIRSLSHSATDRVYWYQSAKYLQDEAGVNHMIAVGPGNVSDLAKRDLSKDLKCEIVNNETLDQVLKSISETS